MERKKNYFLPKLRGNYSPILNFNPESEEDLLKQKIYNSISLILNEMDDN